MGSAFGKMRVKVLIVGLDNSGKTSIVNWLRQKGEQVAPTVGYNNEEIERHNLKFEFIDMSGQQQYRDMWEQFAQKIDGVIFVIDASDQLRYTIMAHEFRSLYEHIKQVPILIYANKSDAKDAKPASYFQEMLQLKQIKNPSICVESSVMTGDGIDKGLKLKKNEQILYQNMKLLYKVTNQKHIFDNIISILRPFELIHSATSEPAIILKKYQNYKTFVQQEEEKQFLDEVDQRLKQYIPDQYKLRLFFKLYQYPKHKWSKFIFRINQSVRGSQSEQLIRLGTCLECINIGLSLHNLVENYKYKSLPFWDPQRLIYKKLSDKKLILGGDYFHAKASVLSTNILDRIEFPFYLSIVEEDAARYVYYQKQLTDISLENVYQLAYYNGVSAYAYSTLLTNLLNNNDQEQAFKAGLYLGLHIEFREQLKQFIGQKNQLKQDYSDGKNSYYDKSKLPMFFYLQHVKAHDYQSSFNFAIIESEKIIQSMLEQSKTHFKEINADFQHIINI